jgi:hypothetical protein
MMLPSSRGVALAGLALFFSAPLDALPQQRKAVRSNQPNVANENWPIKNGYVAFGDSFATGMVTGITTTDACRVGENNYTELLFKWTNKPDIDFQNHVCSGDTVMGINRQIDEWASPENHDLATISVGGNDVGFADIVKSCVINANILNPWKWRTYREEAKTQTRVIMNARGEGSLYENLQAAYRRILVKGIGPIEPQLGPTRRGALQLGRIRANRAAQGPVGAESWHNRINRRFLPLSGSLVTIERSGGYHLAIAYHQPLFILTTNLF